MTPGLHYVNQRPLDKDYPEGTAQLIVGMGCFWGAERRFWTQDNVWVTAVGYAGGEPLNPSYDAVCTGTTGHAEVVHIVYKDNRDSLQNLLKVFWESHDPTQGMRQGNDIGSQYRSVLYASNTKQLDSILQSKDNYQAALGAASKADITTEIKLLSDLPHHQQADFFYAEEYHQQYLAKNPNGYCGLKGTGVSCSF
jgi:peptide-methionine (S)-S-oxide reductase